jgi:hypothetical protein
MIANALSIVHQVLSEPALSFDALDTRQRHANPLAGLTLFGPFSEKTWKSTDPVVRVATLGPSDSSSSLKTLLEQLRKSADPIERRDYLPPYPGFRQAFKARLVPAVDSARVYLRLGLEAELRSSAAPQQTLAAALTDSLNQLQLLRHEFDVIAIYLPNRWRPYFLGKGFHLHDHIKVYAARLGLPTQILTQDAVEYRCRASVRWRLSTALYAKAGGTPYKLATGRLLNPSAAYIGLAYGVRDAGLPGQQFVVCCSQMFDAQGGGLEFIAHDVADEVDTKNPLLSREDMRKVIGRSLAVYADRHAGRRPESIVLHKQTPFTEDETAGAIDAWGSPQGLSCLSINHTTWRGVLVSGTQDGGGGGVTYGYAVDRGTIAQIDDFTALLWISGNSRLATHTGRNFLPGQKGTPRPLRLTRHAGAGSLVESAAQILALSKMNWNSDSLYSSLPATISFAQVLAGVVKTEKIPNVPYDFRLFI